LRGLLWVKFWSYHCVWSMQCNLEFVYQLSIYSRIEVKSKMHLKNIYNFSSYRQENTLPLQ
jgi:hypothetical protein